MYHKAIFYSVVLLLVWLAAVPLTGADMTKQDEKEASFSLIVEPGYYVYVDSSFGQDKIKARVSRHCKNGFDQ